MTRHNRTSWLCLKKNGWGWLYFSYCTYIVLLLYNIPSSKSMFIKCILIIMVKLICSSRIVNWQGKQMVENKTNKMDLKNVLLMKSDTSGLYICLRYDPNVLRIWYFVYCFISMGFTFSLFAISFWKEKYLEKMMKVCKYLYYMQKPLDDNICVTFTYRKRDLVLVIGNPPYTFTEIYMVPLRVSGYHNGNSRFYLYT